MSKSDSLTEDDDSFLNLYSTKSVTSTYRSLVEKLKLSENPVGVAGAEKRKIAPSKRDEVMFDVDGGEIGIENPGECDVVVLDDPRDSDYSRGLRRSSRIGNLRGRNPSLARESTLLFTGGRTRGRKNKANQGREAANASRQKPASSGISVEDDVNYEVSIKVIWKSASVRTFRLRRFQKFSKVFERFMQEENVSCDKIYLTVKERKISPSDTPDSLNLQVFDFIEGGVLTYSNSAPGEKEKNENCPNDEDSVTVKLQDVNKHVHKFTMNKNDMFKSMMIRYAEQIETPLDKIKFYFDGEALSHSDTPNSLGLDNNEIIDVKIM